MSRLNAAVLALALLAGAGVANAKPLRQQQIIVCNQQGCSESVSYRRSDEGNLTIQRDATVIGSRPAGCPHRYCGCEASLYLFGRIIPELNLAWNWARKFPRTVPAPRMAAARRGHVMVLISHVSGTDWLVHDGNSGGGKTRRHVRSIKGYVIVDPSAHRVASR